MGVYGLEMNDRTQIAAEAWRNCTHTHESGTGACKDCILSAIEKALQGEDELRRVASECSFEAGRGASHASEQGAELLANAIRNLRSIPNGIDEAFAALAKYESQRPTPATASEPKKFKPRHQPECECIPPLGINEPVCLTRKPDSASVGKDVHTEHCCVYHGCKYMDENCTVAIKQKQQSFYCESCDQQGRFAATPSGGDYLKSACDHYPNLKHAMSPSGGGEKWKQDSNFPKVVITENGNYVGNANDEASAVNFIQAHNAMRSQTDKP